MAASAVSAGLRFLAFPAFAGLMTPEDFGRVSLFLATVPFLSFLAGWNLAVPWVVDWHGAGDDENRRRMGAALLVLLGMSGAMCLLLPPFVGILESRMGFGLGLGGYLLMVLAAASGAMSTLYLELDKIRLESSRYLSSSVLLVCLQLGASMGWVLFLDRSFEGFLGAYAVGGFLVVVFQVLRRCRSWNPWFPKGAQIVALVRRGTPTTFSTAFALVAGLVDRQFVHASSGFAAVAYYSMGAKIGEIVQQILIVPLLASFVPVLLATFHKDPEQFPARFETAWKRFLVVSILASTALGAGLDLLYRLLLPSAYEVSIPITLIFVCGFSLGGMGQMWMTGVMSRGNLVSLLPLTVVSAIASLVLNALLTPAWGGMGAAWAMILVQGITSVSSWGIARVWRGLPALGNKTQALVGLAFLSLGGQLGAELAWAGSWKSMVVRWGIATIAWGVLLQTAEIRQAIGGRWVHLRGQFFRRKTPDVP
ncbi:MAG: oligosaccharide flippase family protein [Fibrobacteria bacterium]|nr:oligosaccharide flippase family protein [Fibrobacteria bacterium]